MNNLSFKLIKEPGQPCPPLFCSVQTRGSPNQGTVRPLLASFAVGPRGMVTVHCTHMVPVIWTACQFRFPTIQQNKSLLCWLLINWALLSSNNMGDYDSKLLIKPPRRQYFSLPYFVISHLLETPSPSTLQKLQKTCKYMYIRKQVLVIRWQHICVTDPDLDGPGIIPIPKGGEKKQLWLLTLACRGPNSFTDFRPQIYRLSLSYLEICMENLSLNDIDFLLPENNRIRVLCLWHTRIRDARDGSFVPMHYILGKVPYIIKFYYGNFCDIVSNASLEKLNSIKFLGKIEKFNWVIYQNSEKLEAIIFFEFIKANAEPGAIFEIEFAQDLDQNDTWKTQMDKLIYYSFPEDERPKFCIANFE